MQWMIDCQDTTMECNPKCKELHKCPDGPEEALERIAAIIAGPVTDGHDADGWTYAGREARIHLIALRALKKWRGCRDDQH